LTGFGDSPASTPGWALTRPTLPIVANDKVFCLTFFQKSEWGLGQRPNIFSLLYLFTITLKAIKSSKKGSTTGATRTCNIYRLKKEKKGLKKAIDLFIL
jgi:hypothetical protein